MAIPAARNMMLDPDRMHQGRKAHNDGASTPAIKVRMGNPTGTSRPARRNRVKAMVFKALHFCAAKTAPRARPAIAINKADRIRSGDPYG